MEINHRPIIAVTMGDPTGIGPETVVRTVAALRKSDYPLVIIGDPKVFSETAKNLRVNVDHVVVDPRPQRERFAKAHATLLPVKTNLGKDTKPGHPTAASGKAAISFVEKAVELALIREVDAVVTAPIIKKAANDAGYFITGHTDFLATRTNTTKYAMCFVADDKRVAVVTGHVPLRKVHGRVRLVRVIRTVLLLDEFLRKLGVAEPRIAVTGLNPHAGEDGILGGEEKTEIQPAVEACRVRGFNVAGPMSAEAAFLGHLNGQYDGIVTMFHDQGLLPMKVLAPFKTVNVTLGLPFVRTSPGHGAAPDIAGRGVAKPDGLKNAIHLAAVLARTRRS